MRRHREGEPHLHAAGITLDRCVDKLLHTREVYDLVELAFDLGAAHTENGAVKIDVFASGELGMKAGADLEQTCDAADDSDAPLARLGDARQDFQEGRFAGAVAANDAEHLATLNFKANVLQRPEFLGRLAAYNGAAARRTDRPFPHIARHPRSNVTQGCIALALDLVTDDVFLAEPFGADDDIAGHQIKSAKVRSVRRKWAMPIHRNSTTTPRLKRKPGRYSGESPPRMHQRKPSMTPTTGLRLYQNPHCSDTTAVEKPTGDTYSPNCTMNGMI